MRDGKDAEPASSVPQGAADATTGASLVAGGTWKAASSLLPQAYALIVSVVAARYLGADGMGAQSYISFVSISATTLFSSGFPVAITRAIGDARGRSEPEVVRALVRWGWRVQLAAGAAGGVLVAAYGLTRRDLRDVWLIAAVAAIASVAHAAPYAVLAGMQAWRAASIRAIAGSTIATIATIVVLVLGGGIAGMFAVELAAALLNLAWTSALSRRAIPAVAPAPIPGMLRSDVRRFAGFLTVSAVLTLIVWRRSEFFFLDHYSTDAAIAMYSIPFAMTAALLRVPEAIAAVWFPAVATLMGAQQHDRVRAGFGRLVRLISTLALPVAAAALVLGPALLTLVYGDEYAEAGTVLRIMALGLVAIPTVNVASTLLTGLGRVRAQLGVGVFAAVVNISLDVVLIPRFHASGAALANLAAQLAAGVPIVVLARRAVGHFDVITREFVHAVLVTAVAAGAGALAMAITGSRLDLLVGLVVSGGVFAAGVITIPIVRVDDLDWLETSAGRMVGRLVARARKALLWDAARRSP